MQRVRATGTEQGMAETFGSTCHGAGRAQSRNKSRNKLSYEQVLEALKTRGIAIRVASPKLVMEEAPESYKVLPAAPARVHGCRHWRRSPCTDYGPHSAASRLPDLGLSLGSTCLPGLW